MLLTRIVIWNCFIQPLIKDKGLFSNILKLLGFMVSIIILSTKHTVTSWVLHGGWSPFRVLCLSLNILSFHEGPCLLCLKSLLWVIIPTWYRTCNWLTFDFSRFLNRSNIFSHASFSIIHRRKLEIIYLFGWHIAGSKVLSCNFSI